MMRLVVLSLLLCLGAFNSALAQRVALVIGNSTYAHVPGLPNTLNDADDVAASLGRLGFEVSRVKNGRFDDMRRAFRDFGRRSANAEMAIIFYAGHGIEVGGENWLIPVDAELLRDADTESEAISLKSAILQVAGARHLGLVLLDACRVNPFATRMQRTARTRAVDRGLARVEPADNVLIAYAAKEGTTASDGSGRNSPFTRALLDHIEKPGLEVNFLFRAVRDDVLSATNGQQQPFVYGSLSKQSVYFKPPEAAAPVPASDPDAVRKAADAEVARIISQERQKLAADRAQIEEERRKLAAAAPIEQPQAAPPAEADVQPRAVAVEPADTALTPYLTPLRDKDKGRILRLAASRTEAIAKSVQNAAGDTKSRTAVAAAQGLLATPATPASASQIAGRWRCRSLSIGGSLGENSPEFAAAIGNFYDCQIENSRNGLTFKKLTGSMKKLATLSPLPDGRMLYYGTSVAQDERLPVYPAGDDYGHEVGVLEQLGDGRLRLELPDCNTSGSASHEVIELVRARK